MCFLQLKVKVWSGRLFNSMLFHYIVFLVLFYFILVFTSHASMKTIGACGKSLYDLLGVYFLVPKD